VRQRGFYALELLVALGIFLISQGRLFSLLGSSQKHSRPSRSADSFSGSQVGLGPKVRGCQRRRLSPTTFFNPYILFVRQRSVRLGPGYTVLTPCQIGTGGGERVTLQGISTSSSKPSGIPRTLAAKCNGFATNCRGQRSCAHVWERRSDPATATAAAGILAPFVQNVINNSSPAQIATDISSPILPCSRQEPFRGRWMTNYRSVEKIGTGPVGNMEG